MKNVLESRNRLRSGREISDKEICQFVVGLVMPLFAFAFNGKFELKDMVRVIVHACSHRISIEQATKRFKKAPKAPAIRFHLREKLDLIQIEKIANEILQELAKTILSGRWLEFAIDLTFIPYHGKPKKNEAEIVISKAKNGTTHFHAHATLYLIVLGKRFTIALKYIKKGTSNLEIISCFLEIIESLGLKIKRLYLDKGFAEVPVINYLKERDINTIIAIPLKGKTIKAYLKGRKSKIIIHTMKSQKTKASATFSLALVCKYSKSHRPRFENRGILARVHEGIYSLLSLKISSKIGARNKYGRDRIYVSYFIFFNSFACAPDFNYLFISYFIKMPVIGD